ncbi:MAG: hypothetical protein K0S56_1249 [Microvirga sp.]|nr:hypothetical protein [Microvirga sp.]
MRAVGHVLVNEDAALSSALGGGSNGVRPSRGRDVMQHVDHGNHIERPLRRAVDVGNMLEIPAVRGADAPMRVAAARAALRGKAASDKCTCCHGRGIKNCARTHLGVPGLCFDCDGLAAEMLNSPPSRRLESSSGRPRCMTRRSTRRRPSLSNMAAKDCSCRVRNAGHSVPIRLSRPSNMPRNSIYRSPTPMSNSPGHTPTFRFGWTDTQGSPKGWLFC